MVDIFEYIFRVIERNKYMYSPTIYKHLAAIIISFQLLIDILKKKKDVVPTDPHIPSNDWFHMMTDW